MYSILITNYNTDETVVVLCSSIQQVIETTESARSRSQQLILKSLPDTTTGISFEQYKSDCVQYVTAQLAAHDVCL